MTSTDAQKTTVEERNGAPLAEGRTSGSEVTHG